MISALEPDTLYEISISPFTDLGDGYHVAKNVRTFPEGIVHGKKKMLFFLYLAKSNWPCQWQ